MTPIQVSRNKIEFAYEYLGSDSAYVWVGHGFDPLDNDDGRVEVMRQLMSKYYPHIPYGLNVDNKSESGEVVPLSIQNGYYQLDVSWWPEGVYRLNYHSLLGVASDKGTPLSRNRDQDVSWAKWDTTSEEVRPYLHKEKNGAGYCFRVLINPDRSILPFGDLQAS